MEENSKSIKVYARIKPYDDSKGSELIEYDIYDRVSVDSNIECLRSKIVFNHKPSGEAVNNKAEQQTFRFCKVFDQDTQQWEIYEVVAKPVVDSVLEGYNGTVFAYGQTGSGKTYSITGGPDKYEDRGIIPRSIQQIFEAIRQLVADIIASVFISYCEIYNETGYDLLDAAPKARKKLEDLPRVSISEDIHGNFHFRNLSLKKVETEEEALDLLFLGDSNRVTAETPMNKTSSRSHCVFTIVIATRSVSSGIVRRSKLNLVDLAGSERVSKTGINGKTLEEAKNINLSLHFLEQVIVALNTPECKHIPYRNSIMTIVLKDSLGGNCLTTMLATLSAEQENIWETISTCRFAQRVALIKNEVFVNEELDPQMEVKILKEDIKALRKQLSLAGAPRVDVELTPDEIGECQTLVQQILSKENMDSMPQIPADLRKINRCTWLLKCAVADAEKGRSPDVKKLVGLLREREEEIASLKGSSRPSADDSTGSRPRSQSASTRTYRARAGSAFSSRSRPRDSQQLEDDRDIVSRVEANVRRFGDLRSLLETTRCVQGGDEMDEFIASVIHQIHDEERDYRMLLAMHNSQQMTEPYSPRAVEDLLVEQIEISKLKILFDFRNLYQERVRGLDSKMGTSSLDQRSAGGRSPRKCSNQAAGTGPSLPTLEETSSNLMNLPNAAGAESLSVCDAPSAKRKKSEVSAATKQSIVTANKTDISLENASVRPEEAPSPRKLSGASTATRRTSGFSTVVTVSNNLKEIESAGDAEASSSRKGSAASAATGKPVTSTRGSHVSEVPFDSKNHLENVTVNPDEASSSRKRSVASTDSRRTANSPRVSSRVSASPTNSDGSLENVTNLEKASLSRVGSAVSAASRSPGRVSTKDAVSAILADYIIALPDGNGSRSRVNDSTISAAIRESLSPWTGGSSMISSKSIATPGMSSLRPEIGSLREESALSIAARFDNMVLAEQTASNISVLSSVTAVETAESEPDNTQTYINERANSQSRSDTARRSFLPQLGSNSYTPKTNQSENVFGLRTITESPTATDSATKHPLEYQSKASSSHPNDVSSLQKVSASSSATRRSAGPQAGTSGLKAMSHGIPVGLGYLQTESLENGSDFSTVTGRSVGSKTGTSAVSRKSNVPANVISEDTDINQTGSPSSLQNMSAGSADSRRSSTANYLMDSVIVPMYLEATSCIRHHDKKCKECPGSTCSQISVDNFSVDSEDTPSSRKASSVSAASAQSGEPSMAEHSTTTRRSLTSSLADNSKVSAATRQSLETSMVGHSKVSAATRESLENSMANRSQASAATRPSFETSMADRSKVSAATKPSLEPSMADHSKVSAVTRPSLETSMADRSKVSAATRASLETSMADRSKVSAATRPSLETSMADRSKVSAATRASLETSMADRSKVSAATKPSLETSMGDHSRVSAATKPSLETSMADRPKVSAATRPSLETSRPDHSKVSAATRPSLEPSMADHSKVSAATRPSLETSMADRSKVSAATKPSLETSMADRSKVSAAIKPSLETSMADRSKVSAATRPSLEPSMADRSKVSAATRPSLEPSMADHSKVSAATRPSLETSMADRSRVSAATRPSLETSMADHSRVSAATRQSLETSMTPNSNVSLAHSNDSAAVESESQTAHCSDMTSYATTPASCSLIVDYIAPTDEIPSQPNSIYLNVAAKGTSSFVATSHHPEVSPSSVDSSVTTYQSTTLGSRRASSNEPNINVDWRNTSQVGCTAPDSNAASIASTPPRSTVPSETDKGGSSRLGHSVIPLESLAFPSGAVPSTFSSVSSKVSKKAASPLPATSPSINAEETVFSKGQLSALPDDARLIAELPTVSAVGQPVSQAQRSVSAKSGEMPTDARVDDANVNASPTIHAPGVSSTLNKGGISPRQARRLSIKRNSTSQETDIGNVSTHSQVPQPTSAMRERPATPEAASKSLSQKVASFHPPIADDKNVDASLKTIFKDVEGVQPSVNTFKPRGDMHQCEEDKKCLSLAATQAEFDAFYGLDRTDSYTCTITIPSKSSVAEDSLACCEVIPCTSSEFVATTLAATGKTPSNFSPLSCLESSVQSNSTPPAIGVKFEDSDKSEPLIYLDESCLTGDPEIDEEIIAFYKSQNCPSSKES